MTDMLNTIFKFDRVTEEFIVDSVLSSDSDAESRLTELRDAAIPSSCQKLDMESIKRLLVKDALHDLSKTVDRILDSAKRTAIDDEALSVVPALLFEAFDYGQFADDFNQPLAKPIRLALRAMLSTVRASKK